MIKILTKSIREFKRDTILAPIFVACEVVCDVLIPIAMSLIIDNGVKKGDMNYIYLIGAAMFGLSLLSLVFGVTSGRLASRASVGFARNLRADMFEKIQTYSFANIDKFSTPSLITRLTVDINYIQMSFQLFIRVMFRSPSMIAFALTAALLINLQMALIFVVAIPVLAFSLFFLMSKAFKHFRKMFTKYDEINQVIGENLKGIRTVKSFVKEEDEIAKFEHAAGELKAYTLRAERIIVWNGPVLQLTVYACIICISLFGAKLVIADDLSDGKLLTFFTYTYQILMNLNMLSMVLVMFAISRPSMTRVCEILQEESDITNPESPIMEVPNGNILFKDVSFSYEKENHDKFVLKDINLAIKSGQTVGILGGTGSAKSTLVNLISRLYDVSEGQLLVGDHDVREYDIEVLRNKVAVVLQKNVLFSGTIKDNLLWGNLNATDQEIKEACQIAQADDFITSFDDQYDTVIDQGGTNVSGGQKQRLCIARALLKKPKILILDDSTSAVDTKTDALLRVGFKNSLPDVTKIIVAQRISSVEDADIIVVLDQGRIVGCGDHQQLLATNPIYQEVYETQTKGVGSNE